MNEIISQNVDLVIIGAGPAGLAAAINAKKNGINDLIIIERNNWLGGILPQCIHDGFGLELFQEALTGPEYAQKYIDKIEELKIPYMLNSLALEITTKKEVFVAKSKGLYRFKAKAIILSMGCRERTRGQISIPGTRPAGIYTAGVAQNFINLKNLMVGKNIVILGSGDIGLIMARRLTLEGARVHAVIEILPHNNGLPRNIQQCLIDYEIPFLKSHTVTDIEGQDRVESVTINPVDEKLQPIYGKEKKIPCDTLLLSIGLIPENELSKTCGIRLDPNTNGAIVDENLQTNIPGIFACGNVLHVHDIVDYVTLEAEWAGKCAAEYIQENQSIENKIPIQVGNGIRYVLPQKISPDKNIELLMRVTKPYEAISISFIDEERIVKTKKFRKVHPAQMIKIKITKKETKGLNSLKVEVMKK